MTLDQINKMCLDIVNESQISKSGETEFTTVTLSENEQEVRIKMSASDKISLLQTLKNYFECVRRGSGLWYEYNGKIYHDNLETTIVYDGEADYIKKIISDNFKKVVNFGQNNGAFTTDTYSPLRGEFNCTEGFTGIDSDYEEEDNLKPQEIVANFLRKYKKIIQFLCFSFGAFGLWKLLT